LFTFYIFSWWYNMYLSKLDKQEIKVDRAEDLDLHYDLLDI